MPEVPPAAARVFAPLPESERAAPPAEPCGQQPPPGPEIETCC
jgi:hypothetical protein